MSHPSECGSHTNLVNRSRHTDYSARHWLRYTRKLAGSPVMSASGRDCSFLQAGTKTVTSLWPLSKNQSTANFIPRQEKTSLFPWLKDYFRTLKTQQNLNLTPLIQICKQM